MKASKILPLVLVPLTLAFTSCTVKKEEAAKVDAPEQAGDAADAANKTAADAVDDTVANVIEGVHSVECGCSDTVGADGCGNYVQVDGKYLEIEGDLGLGSMEWCGKSGHKAQVKGVVKGDKFMGESLTVVP